jgi:hypothetical protein
MKGEEVRRSWGCRSFVRARRRTRLLGGGGFRIHGLFGCLWSYRPDLPGG